MNLQDQWTNLYTEVFKLHKEMTQDGSLFLNNKTKLPLSVRVTFFFRIIILMKTALPWHLKPTACTAPTAFWC